MPEIIFWVVALQPSLSTPILNIYLSTSLGGSKGEFIKPKDSCLFKTNRFDSLKNSLSTLRGINLFFNLNTLSHKKLVSVQSGNSQFKGKSLARLGGVSRPGLAWANS